MTFGNMRENGVPTLAGERRSFGRDLIAREIFRSQMLLYLRGHRRLGRPIRTRY